MDEGAFGPMTSAEGDAGDISLESQLAFYQKRLEVLEKQRAEDESSFGQKRAQFMEIYSKKEDELKQLRSELDSIRAERQTVTDELDRTKVELNDLKTATAISETGRDDEMQTLRRKYNEDVASMQHIVKESVAQAEVTAKNKQHDEASRYQSIIKKLEQELEETKQKLLDGGMLSSVVKTISKKVGAPLGATSKDEEDENLEESMKKAQEDANLLKSVVLPLEAEIAQLKEQLHNTQVKLQEYDPSYEITIPPPIETSTDTLTPETTHDLEDKIKDLTKNLETEKSSRSDLEMYVAVLSAQIDKLRDDLQKSYKELQSERREHNTLKQTWAVANDQFLESQRLLMMDMNRIESLLTPEQEKTLEELKQADAEREAQEKKVHELEEKRKAEERKASESNELSEASVDKTTGSLNSLISDDLLKMDSGDETAMRRSASSQSMEPAHRDVTDNVVFDTRSLGGEGSERTSPDKQMNIHSLTKAQHKAIAETNFELKLNDDVLAGVKAKSEQFNIADKRLVSDTEWNKLQKELVAARERLGKPCDMCKNYESQLQQLQDTQKKAQAQARNVERQLENERSTLKSMQEYTTKLETSLKDTAIQAQSQISEILEEMKKQESLVQRIQSESTSVQSELHSEMEKLTAGREKLQAELRKLEEENDNLVGKHSKHSQQMQEETINLPDNLEDMQLLLLKYREDVIAAKVAKEHLEERLKSELMFLKDQVVAEQQEKSTMEESLSNEISHLQEEVTILQSVKSELERITKIKQEAEAKLMTSDQALANTQAKSKQLIHALQNQVAELNNTKSTLERQVQEKQYKIQGLQVDLDNSEAVQRDFVKLSQSLQIQLEQIRSSTNEVRWQHEEDIDDCHSCHRPFTGNNKKKNHCRHCGQIFCADCLTKTVKSGPKMRPSRVCDVCHTILVQDATPYFSVEPPQTPD